MAPSKSKIALPSTSMTFPRHPITMEQWTTALHRIKILYLRGQLRYCATRCDQLLSETNTMPNPLFASYLHFYSALSSEGLARLIHNLSASKISALLQAQESYRRAVASLPARDTFENATASSPSETATELSSPTSSEVPSDANHHACSIWSPYTPITPLCPSSPTTTSSSAINAHHNAFEGSPPVKRPSPLRVHKQNKPTLRLITTNMIDTPPHSPPTQIFPRLTTTSPHPSPSNIFSATTSIWLRTRARERFTAHLDSFRDMLARHMDGVDGLIRTAELAQRNRRVGKSLGTLLVGAIDGNGAIAGIMGSDDDGDGDGKGEVEKVMTKIRDRARARQQEHGRLRFQPERYALLCEQALNEL